jgi:hypothetical protein|tara:strand:+ start:285 stop:395 length:111 start_codon:yes stop_codon:yes gene_type:complete
MTYLLAYIHVLLTEGELRLDARSGADGVQPRREQRL